MFAFAILGLLGIGLVVNVLDDNDDNSFDDDETRAEGTTGDDFLETGGGDDTVFADSGNDAVLSGAGEDRVFGAEGEDFIVGEDGDDFLRGGDDDDLLFGSEGEDTLIGDAGDDLLDGTDNLDAAGFLRAAEEAASNGTALSDAEFEAFVDYDADTGQADQLFGGAGDDDIYAGNNDFVDTGTGQDEVLLGEWIDGVAAGEDIEEAPVIDNFNPSQDSIVYFFEGETPPDVAWSEEDDGGNLVIGNEVVAQFTNANFDGLVNETIQFVRL